MSSDTFPPTFNQSKDEGGLNRSMDQVRRPSLDFHVDYFFYVEDLDAARQSWTDDRAFYPSTITYGLTFVLGLIGNTFVIVLGLIGNTPGLIGNTLGLTFVFGLIGNTLVLVLVLGLILGLIGNTFVIVSALLGTLLASPSFSVSSGTRLYSSLSWATESLPAT